MGIFTSTSDAEAAPETPESLKAALIEARSERDERVASANADYDLDKAWVIDEATKRATVVNGLIDDLRREQGSLTDVLADANQEPVDQAISITNVYPAPDGDAKATREIMDGTLL